MSKRQRQAKLSRYFDTSKARKRADLPRQPFVSSFCGTGCGRSRHISDMSSRIYENYVEHKHAAGWKHKMYVCCPKCALEDSKNQPSPFYSTHELLAYIEANLVVLRNLRQADYEYHESEREKLEDKIEALQQEIDHFHHLDAMRARDKENKRKREN